MRDVIYCDGFELYQYDSDQTPQGFVWPAFSLTAPDGVARVVSADKMKDALDRLFEECA